jgi:hypothetical protein
MRTLLELDPAQDRAIASLERRYHELAPPGDGSGLRSAHK